MCKVVYMFRSNNLGVHESIQLILTNCTCTDGSTTDQPSAVTPFPHIFFLVTYVLHKSVSCLIAEENGFHVLMHMFQRHPPRKLKVETQVIQASTARMKSSIMDPKHQRTQCDMQKSQTSIDIWNLSWTPNSQRMKVGITLKGTGNSTLFYARPSCHELWAGYAILGSLVSVSNYLSMWLDPIWLGYSNEPKKDRHLASIFPRSSSSNLSWHVSKLSYYLSIYLSIYLPPSLPTYPSTSGMFKHLRNTGTEVWGLWSIALLQS